MILDNNIELPLHSVQRERREVHPLYTQESELLVFPKHKRVQSLFSNEMSQSAILVNVIQLWTSTVPDGSMEKRRQYAARALEKYGARRINGKKKTVPRQT